MTGFLSQFGAAKRGHKINREPGSNPALVSYRRDDNDRFDLDLAIFEDKTLLEYMGVSKNKAIPKWMVYNGKPY